MSMVESYVDYIHELYYKLQYRQQKASAHIVSMHIYHPSTHTHTNTHTHSLSHTHTHTQRGVVSDFSCSWS